MLEIIIILQNAGNYLIWPLCGLLLILILLQGGAGDISSAFGGGGQLDSSLGVGAQQKISKVTGWFVALFLVLVVILSIDPNPDLGTDKKNADEKAKTDEPAVPVIDDGDPSNDVQPAIEGEPVIEEMPSDPEANKEAKTEEKADAVEDPKPETAVKPADADANEAGEGEIEVVE